MGVLDRMVKNLPRTRRVPERRQHHGTRMKFRRKRCVVRLRLRHADVATIAGLRIYKTYTTGRLYASAGATSNLRCSGVGKQGGADDGATYCGPLITALFCKRSQKKERVSHVRVHHKVGP